MKMKDAVKLGFGFALGAYLFKLCVAAVNVVSDKVVRDKLDADPEFRVRVKTISPELYAKYRKETKDVTAE